MKLVTDQSFRKYGRILEGYDFTELLTKMEKTPCPTDGPIYVASVSDLEACAVAKDIMMRAYGGLPIEIGYCNGNNKKLNAIEYHRSSELDIAVGRGLVLLLGKEEDITPEFTYDTSLMEAFYLPAGVGVELFATTLHYAPCTAAGEEGFRCVIVLPEGTNTDLEEGPWDEGEGKLITAKNKWLIAHSDAGITDAFCGLIGENLTVE